MEWGKHYATLQAIERACGFKPPALAIMPEVFDDAISAWLAFLDLSNDRPYIATMGHPCPQRIPFRDIKAYAEAFGPHDPDHFADFVRLVRALDSEWLEHWSRNAGTSTEQGE